MDLATIGTIGTLVGVAMAIGGGGFHVGQRISWAESREEMARLKGKIDTLTTEIVGLKKEIAIAERHNKFNADRWADAQRKAAEAQEQLKVAEAKLEALEAQKAAGASQAEIDRTTLEIKSSLNRAFVANTGTNAILSSGPVWLLTVPPEEPKTKTPLEEPKTKNPPEPPTEP